MENFHKKCFKRFFDKGIKKSMGFKKVDLLEYTPKFAGICFLERAVEKWSRKLVVVEIYRGQLRYKPPELGV